jgi:hypothetical protein
MGRTTRPNTGFFQQEALARIVRNRKFSEGLLPVMDENKELDKAFYEIQVKGCLDAWREDLFDGMSVASRDNVTTISGFVPDQAALHGLLAKVRDFGLVLLSVKAISD